MLRSSRFNIFSTGVKTSDYKHASEKLNAKIKGTFIEKFVNYMKNVGTDYKEVAVSVRNDMKAKPVKATFFFTGMGFLLYSLTHNPNEQSFRAKFIHSANEVSLVSSNLVNPNIVEHLKQIQRAYNKDLVRHTSFGVLSIIWLDKYSDQCGIYETNCSYLQLPYRKIASHVIDVGFLNIWWVLSRKMLDYDINY